jgi:non-specific serine/threonine protein kinase/serine/threonine-protein kinase
MKCLEKDRTRPYETANGLARNLERFLRDEPVSATAPTGSYKLRKFIRRNRTAVVVGSTILALALIALVVSTALAIRASKAERLATRFKNEVGKTNQKLQEQLAVTTLERARADTEKSLAQRNLYIARLNLAQRAMERNDLGRVRQILDQTADFPDRGFEWFYLEREAHFELRTLRGHTSLI